VSACARPLALDTLLAYWRRELAESEVGGVEEHTFACAACARALDDLARLADGARRATRSATLRFHLPRALADRLAQDGLQLRHYQLAPGDRVPCGVGADDDLVVTWLRVAAAPGERVDLAYCNPDGSIARRVADVPLSSDSVEVAYAMPGSVIRSYPSMIVRLRLLGVSAAGERTLGDYTLEHTGHQA